MKKILSLVAFALILMMFGACTADYDTFGTSHYKVLNDIGFENQNGMTSVNPAEHLLSVTMQAPPESLSTWDSVTIEFIDMSSMATIHIVDGRFKEEQNFPKDSVTLDSLANALSYDRDALRPGDKIRVPKSLMVYLMIVAENGDPDIWQLKFTIPGVVASSSSVAEDVSSSSENTESSSSVQSSSSAALSDNNSFKISFKDELENKTSGDTVFVTFAQGTDLSKVVLDTSIIHRSAKIDVDPAKVSDWSKIQTFVVTAEDGTEKTWIVITQAVLSSATDFQIWFKNQLKVNRSGDTIAVKLQNSETIAEAAVDSFKVSVGASISPDPKETKWGEIQNFTVTAEDGTEKSWVLTLDVAAADEVASDEKELISISAKGEIKSASIDKEKKTILIHLADQQALSAVELTVKISETASQDLQAGAIDLRSPVVMTITAEDASTAVWTISADFPLSSEADIKTFALDGITATEGPTIDANDRVVAFTVEYGTDLSRVFFEATYSQYATLSTELPIDLSSGTAILKVTAQDSSVTEWKIITKVTEPPVVSSAPRILSMKIAGSTAVVDSVYESGEWIHRTHFDDMPFLADLNSVVVDEIRIPEGASISGIENGSSYDLGMGVKALVSKDGETCEYIIKAGYQLPGNDFNTWKSNGVMSPDSVWGNANTVGTTTSKYSAGSVVGAQIKTTSILGKIASGSLYTADFNPNGVGTLAMASSSTWPDGNELLDFGKKFGARPTYIDVTFSYNGAGDSCDVYLVLENRTGDKNRTRTSTDVNKLVASAWYRSTTGDNTGRTNPDVVSISEENADGFRTMRMKLKYGEPLTGSPIENSSVFSATLASKDSKAINNSVEQGTGDEPVTHIRLVFASSADGNHYKGKSGATLVVDGIKFIY